MIDLPIGATDFRLSLPEVILLELDDFERAADLSDRSLGELSQWQTYLNVLGLLGFTRWLNEQNADLAIDSEQCTVWQPYYANVLNDVCNLRVDEFKLCLIVIEHLLEDEIAVSRAAIELPNFAAHFYVVLEVDEESEQLAIQGFARHNQLVSYHQSFQAQVNRDWSYTFPLWLFDAELNHLVSYLRRLHPDSIALPTHSLHASTPPLTPAELNTLIAHLQTTEQPLWQDLTWEQGTQVLQNSEFLELLYQSRYSTEQTPALLARLTELFTLLTQPFINVAQWLQGEIDAFAQDAGLFLAQELATASPMLSVDRFERAIAELRNQGIDIPLQPNCVYQDIDLHGIALRLCTAVWAANTAREWSLLFILGMQASSALPNGLTLRVSNTCEVLHEPVTEFDDPFLFAVVHGNVGETFVVTIIPPNQPGLTLPAFGFESV